MGNDCRKRIAGVGDNRAIRFYPGDCRAEGFGWCCGRGENLRSDKTFVGDIVFYVAPNGRPDAAGSFSDPFAQPEQARDAIRALKEKGLSKSVVVYIRGGEYYRDETFLLEGADSGTADCPITYASYPGEQAVFTGGKRVAANKISKVTDQEIINQGD